MMIKREDREIMWEGVHSLTQEELIEACKERGMLFYGITDDQMRQQMIQWVQLSSHPEIPPLLLIWSRCITMTHSTRIGPDILQTITTTPNTVNKQDELLRSTTTTKMAKQPTSLSAPSHTTRSSTVK
eukprot:GHVS01064313.1.p2 GENE.GHVS01064313.1~~GHVS01064313.1.p2  ORF type:complete len:128 (+),score=22.88 GHVS01064313.1:671-1054(+)